MFNLNANYPYQPDINHVALGLIEKLKKNGKPIQSILDVGCGFGLLSKELAKKYPDLDLNGIENSKQACKSASKVLHLLECDIQDIPAVQQGLGGKRFDVIIFSDVLEHLYDPVSIVKAYKKMLTNDGVIIITVPNIANIFSRIALLFGYFNYSETGVMDKTHIRFFNKKNLNRLARDTELYTIAKQYDSILVRWFVPLIKIIMSSNNGGGNIMESKAYRFYFKFVRPVEELLSSLLPSLFAFRLGIGLQKEKSK